MDSSLIMQGYKLYSCMIFLCLYVWKVSSILFCSLFAVKYVNLKDYMMKKNLAAKIINKAFDLYSQEAQEKMKQEYNLIIRDFKKTKRSIDTLSDYLSWFKNLKKADKKIIFWGVPIPLSEKQFIILRILLEEKQIIEREFNTLIFNESRCKRPKTKQKDDIKKSVRDFKRKVSESIEKFSKENDCYFKDKSEEEFKKIFKELIRYEAGNSYYGYTLLTNFSISPRLKIQKKADSDETLSIDKVDFV